MPRKKEKYDADDVSCPTQDYNYHMLLLDLPHTLMKGTRGMRDKGKEFLPKEEAEDTDDYKIRLARSFLFNAFKKTVTKLSGEVFSKPIVLPEGLNEDLAVWSEDIDLSGHNITSFARSLFESGVVDGVTHILVDMPIIPTEQNENGQKVVAMENDEGEVVLRPLTLEVMRENEWRPYFIQVMADQLIGARVVKVKDQVILQQIRIHEVTEEPVGKYGVEEVERIRVLEPGRYQIYKKIENDRREEEWILEDEGETAFKQIPLVTYFTGRPLSQTTAEPPLDDLAMLNLAHWQSYSDQRNILHYARMITYFGKLLDLEPKPGQHKSTNTKAVMGANTLMHGSDENSDLKVVEHSGAAIEAGRNDLKDLEAQMRLYGMSLVLGERTGNVTATEKAIDTAEVDSTLQAMAVGLGEALTKAYGIAAEVMQIEGGLDEQIKVNTDYKSFIQGLELRELREAYLDGILPKQIIIDEYKRRGLISDDHDFEEIEAMIRNERRGDAE